MAGETILIIDDNPDVCILLGQRVLPSYGYRTLTATDGQEGLWQIRTQKPDLILLDLRLPDMTGLDLLHILTSEGYDTPVILITAYGSELIAAQALRLGVRDYIIKPFTLDEIVESVERALTEQRLRRERNALADHLQNCQRALQSFLDTAEEIRCVEDVELNICQLTEVALRATHAQRSQIWCYDRAAESFYLRVAQDSADQRAYLLHKKEGVPEQVREALATATMQEWQPNQEEGEKSAAVALPILQDQQVVAVMVLYLSPEQQCPPSLGMLLLQIVGKWLEQVLDQAALRQRVDLLRGQVQAFGALSEDVLMVLDEQNRIVATTPAVQVMLDQPPETLVGQDFCQWIGQIESPSGELVEWYLQQALGEQGAEHYALFFHDARGCCRQAEVQVLQGRHNGGQMYRYVLFHETTAQHRLEQAVRSMRQLLNEAGHGRHWGLFLTDIDGTIQAVNGNVPEILGLAQEELRGQLLWEVLCAWEGSHLLSEEIPRALREGSSYLQVFWPGGRIESWGVTTWPLLDDQGAPWGIGVLIRPQAEESGPEYAVGGPIDESDLLGGPRVNSSTGA
ncbi:MAG: response regulator [Chloroflexia bacterium]|nr:response regulator [Chloroflexia bacterium]